MDTRDSNTDHASSEASMPDAALAPLVGDNITNKQHGSPQKRLPGPWRESLRRLRRDRRAMLSLYIIAFFIVLPLIGPPIYQHIGAAYPNGANGKIEPEVYHNPYHAEFTHLDEGPSSRYWLGTDNIGRDILARLMQGMLISLVVAIVVEIINVVLGLVIGTLAGFSGGWLDQVLARFTDVMFAFPGLLFAILLTGIFGASADTLFSKIPLIGSNGNARLILVALAIALTNWPLMARFVRGQTLQLKQQQFVEAARTAGTPDPAIILRHIIPNLFSIVMVAATLDISTTIIGEAGLSFLGLGVQPPGSSIGLMINDATPMLDTHPWEVLVPSVVLTLIVLAFSFLGDGLRDAFDPRSKD